MESNRKLLLGIGNPIIDISAQTDSATLDKYGLKFGQTIFANDTNSGFYDVLESTKGVEYIPGGSVTNSIRVTNWMLNKNPNFGCMIVGCIGKDEYGANLSKALGAVNVESVLEENPSEKTSRCGCGIYLKERCLLPQIRASSKLSMEFVTANLDRLLKASILFIEGYFIIEKRDIVEMLAQKFLDAKKEIAFTLSATFMIDFHFEGIKRIADLSNIVFCNEEEAEAFVRKCGLTPEKSIEENLVHIHRNLQRRNRLLVVTCGSSPVLISRFNYETNNLDFVLRSHIDKISSEDIVDTNGCGDAFVGGFMSLYLQGKGLEKCARAGNYASSVIIRRSGCTYPDAPSLNID